MKRKQTYTIKRQIKVFQNFLLFFFFLFFFFFHLKLIDSLKEKKLAVIFM